MNEKLINFRYDEDRYESLKDIARKERRDIKVVIGDLLDDFIKKHGDGNPSYTLDHYSDESFLATPAYHRPISVWDNYLTKCGEKEYKEWVSQLESLLTLERRVTNKR